MNKRGSNQYKAKHTHLLGISSEAWASIWMVAFLTAVLIPLVKPTIESPCPQNGCFVKVVEAAEGRSELQEITDYIVKKFQPEGRTVATHALACFISESGLRTDAYNFNSNGTDDKGIAQINSIHGMGDKAYDWKANIDKAYSIYKTRGWSAWYGKGC